MSDRRPNTRPRRRLLDRLSYANVAATLALFIALGGTAAAVATLPADSVGAPQIRTDAVRSPEIRADAVRSPEIRADAVRSSEIEADAVRSPEIRADAVRSSEIEADAVRSCEIEADAVRSSEIRDETIALADISTAARTALDAPRVVLAEAVVADAPTCHDGPLTSCGNLLSVVLPEGNWLVQAAFTARDNGNEDIFAGCGLVQGDTTLLTSIGIESLGQRGSVASTETAVLTDVVTGVPAGTRVALRCTEDFDTSLQVDDITMTAIEAGTVTGP